VADALTVSYDPERSLEVMKGGTSGPAGSAALVLVLGLQVAALAAVLTEPRGPVVAAVIVCASRAILAIGCVRGVRAARGNGLAVTYAGTVARPAAVLTWVVVAAALTGVVEWAGLDWWRGLVVAGTGLVVGAALTWRCVRRFGGVTGDVFGASIEVTLAAMLLGAT
ncbi:MAG: adenosylcobinamide-GDP ribazoletransferase, partial [Aeromicrobium sp.]